MTRKPVDDVAFEEWDDPHPRYPEFLRFLAEVAPEQVPFVTGERYAPYASHLIVGLQAGELAGAIRFAVQPIGPEAHCPTLHNDGRQLTEAKIHVFAVRPASRGHGIGTELQKLTIACARELGCHQVASYSCYDKVANYHIKLSLGFAAQPEVHGDNEQGVYFLMPLRERADPNPAQTTPRSLSAQ
ncbi:MAG: GNAT family N-acetyltransferase [Candidatus Eisenbacteria bacterium]